MENVLIKYRLTTQCVLSTNNTILYYFTLTRCTTDHICCPYGFYGVNIKFKNRNKVKKKNYTTQTIYIKALKKGQHFCQQFLGSFFILDLFTLCLGLLLAGYKRRFKRQTACSLYSYYVIESGNGCFKVCFFFFFFFKC